MLKIALTGGIASGKSRVAELFSALHVPIIDADVIAREFVAPGQAGLQALVCEFGSDILTKDGELDRAQLRQLIFTDDKIRQRVNALLHPLIRQRMHDQGALLSHFPYVLFVVPLLAESAQSTDYDRVIVVSADEVTRVTRIMHRDHVSHELAMAALDAQAGEAERLQLADDIVINNGSLASLQPQVQLLHEKFLSLAHA